MSALRGAWGGQRVEETLVPELRKAGERGVSGGAVCGARLSLLRTGAGAGAEEGRGVMSSATESSNSI